MITELDASSDPLQRDRLLVIGQGPTGEDVLLADLGRRYPEWKIIRRPTILAGIAELARNPARAVLAGVDASTCRLDDAVSGLREAGGPDTRLILLCAPECEPAARRALASGADDYLLAPLEGDELDSAVGYGRPNSLAGSTRAPVSPPSTDELIQLGASLAAVGKRPNVLIERLATLIRTALRSRGATIVIEGAVATSGEAVSTPVLTAPLTGKGRVIGQLTVSERDDPYTLEDAEKLTHYATVCSHILANASSQRHWRRLAVTDECSGLPNRRYLRTRLEEILARATDERFQVTLLLFDVDDFKAYNDKFGHDAGDEIIRLTGELFRQHCRDQDIVTRYGGDGFAVVFWDPDGPRAAGSKPPDEALAVLERFRDALGSQQFSKLGPSGKGQLTISGGLATFPWDGATVNALLARADEALLSAKRAGKNRIFLVGEGDSDDT